MFAPALTLFFFASLFSIAPTECRIEEIDNLSFQRQIKKNNVSLVLFYIENCVHSQHFRPVYKQVDIDLLNYPQISLFKMDCVKNQRTCTAEDIEGYPSLRFYHRNQHVVRYLEDRSVDVLVKFAIAQLGSSSINILSNDDLQKFLLDDIDSINILGCIEDNNTPLKKAFNNISQELRGQMRFAHSDAHEVCVGIENIIVLFRPGFLHNKYETNTEIYTGEANISKILDFFTAKKHGLVGLRTLENADDFSAPWLVVYHKINVKLNMKSLHYIRNRMLKVASKNRDFHFGVSSIQDFPHDLDDFGIDPVSPTPMTIVLAKSAQSKKYVMTCEFSAKNLETFINAVVNNELTPFIKSLPVPEYKDNDLYKEVVGLNFDELITNNGKDTFVLFYAQMCHFCENAEALFYKLAKFFENETSLLFTKIDGYQNEAPEVYDTSTFPVVYWMAKEFKNNPVMYTDFYDFNSFVKFIFEQSNEPMKAVKSVYNPDDHKEEL